MNELRKVIERAPDQVIVDLLAGVWLVTLVLGALHLPSVI